MIDAIETIARADSAAGEVALRRRGPHTELIVGGRFVMDTVETSTETELAQIPLTRHHDPRRVLIGGLGLGFTTEAVLADPRVEAVTVVDIVAPLLDWARAGLLPVDLGDRRLRLRCADIADVLQTSAGEWDLILLDVDNGPGFLVREENAGLYARAGLSMTAAALAPGGTLAIWSSHRAPDLLATLRSLDVGTAEEVVREVRREGRCFDYAVYLLTRS